MVPRTKYPRTFQLPFSESNSSDDVWWKNCDNFVGKEVVVSEKLDGENTTIYRDGFVHARSVDSSHHPSRSLIKQTASEMYFNIPEGLRLCGENLFAYHSIFYTDLPSLFMAFSMYDGNRCLSWDDTTEYAALLGLEMVPVLYRGLWDEKLIRGLWTGKGTYPTYESDVVFDPKFPEDFRPCHAEGYVVRVVDSFDYERFPVCAAKWVRANHVRTDSHWMERPPVRNLLRSVDELVDVM